MRTAGRHRNQLSVRTLAKRWHDFLFAEIDPLPADLFRIGYAALVLIQCAVMAPQLELYYSEQGLMPWETLTQFRSSYHWTLFEWLPKNRGTLWLLFGILNLSAIALLLGFFSRVQAVIVWVLLVSFHHRNLVILDGEDTVFRSLGLLLILMPIGRSLSIDRAWRLLIGSAGYRRETEAPWALRLAQVQICLVFFAAGMWKAKGNSWVDGTAMYYVSRLDDFFGRFPLPTFFLESMTMMRLTTWSVLAIELCAPILVWFRETRLIGLGLALAMHIGAEYTMNLFLFQWVMMLGWTTFLTREDWRQVAFFFRVRARLKPRLTAVYDGNCAFCLRAARAAQEFDPMHRVSWIDYSHETTLPTGFDASRAHREFLVVSPGGKWAGGFEAFRLVASQSILLWWLVPALYVAPISKLSARAYRWVVSNKTLCFNSGCEEERVNIEPEALDIRFG